MQVYQGMDIGTAKPTIEERLRIPHHLIDIYPPTKQFHAGEFVAMVDDLVPEILSRGNLPVISGGTAYYLKNYLYGLPEVPPTHLSLAKEMEAKLFESDRNNLNEGEPSPYRLELYKKLQAVDPVSASKIHINDSYRLVRALEVFLTNGKPLSSYLLAKEPRLGNKVLSIGLSRDRNELYRRIDLRVSQMMEAGLADEVFSLMEKGYCLNDPGMKAIGYQEFFQNQPECNHFWSQKQLEEIQVAIQKKSRHYAKKQMTFFKSLKGVHWIEADDVEGMVALLKANGFAAFLQ